MRPPPRWAKWSRGVRTRGLRVGLVGGPRPLLFLGSGISVIILVYDRVPSDGHCRIDFHENWLNIRRLPSPQGLGIKAAIAIRLASPQLGQPCHAVAFFTRKRSAAMTNHGLSKASAGWQPNQNGTL